MRRAWLTVMCCLGLGVLGQACDPQPEERPFYIDRLRVLAIRAEPMTITQGEPATISALVRQPGAPSYQYSWSWCPYRPKASQRYACPVTYARYQELIKAAAARFDVEVDESWLAQIPPFELEGVATPSFGHALAPDQVQGLCFLTTLAALEIDTSLQDYFHTMPCEIGFEVTVRLALRGGGESLTTRKSVLWDVGGEVRLTNPRMFVPQVRPLPQTLSQEVLDKLDWFDPSLPRDAQWVDFDPAKPLKLARGIVYELRVRVDLESRDPYLRVEEDEDDKIEVGEDDEESVVTPDGLERSRFVWFTNADLIRESPSPEDLYAKELEADPELELTWRDFNYRHLDLRESAKLKEACPDATAACAMQADILLRDSQLGMSWRGLRATILP